MSESNLQEAGRRLFGWLPLVIILVLLIPFGYALVDSATTESEPASKPFLERPDPQYENCVRDTEYMRFHHWELLRGVREDIVRFGKRDNAGLSECRGCHTSRERFCDQCHLSASVLPDCWGCHYYP
jgi:hypothetical protein